ncbi:MAG: glycosyltransferase [Proteobacteria bacterium]|nr:glycosyltransferase [Pseudomonadota bacterium]
MNALVVTDAWLPQTNGVVRTLQTTQRIIRENGGQLTFVTPNDFKTIPCPTYPEIRLSLFAGPKMERLIDRCNENAIHIATEGPLGWAARAVCVRQGIPFTTAYHTKFPEYVQARSGLPVGVSYALLRRFHNAGQRVMVPAPSMIETLKGWGFNNPVLWSRGVDLTVFKPAPRSRLTELTGPIFICHGRIAVEKNLEAFLKLDLPGHKVIIGDGPDLPKLRRKYPQVIFTGHLSDTEMVAHLQSADVMVFPSVTETFGNVVLEALACGLPVAAFPVTGPKDIIGKAPVGVLASNLKAAALQALELDHKACRKHAEQFTWQNATQQFVDNLALFDPAAFPVMKQKKRA